MEDIFRTSGWILLAHLSRRLRGELIGWESSRRPSVHGWVRASTLSNINISIGPLVSEIFMF